MLMSSKEALGPREDMPDNDGGAEWVDDVLVVGMKEKSIVDATWVMAK
jgi:hypothetical protein